MILIVSDFTILSSLPHRQYFIHLVEKVIIIALSCCIRCRNRLVYVLIISLICLSQRIINRSAIRSIYRVIFLGFLAIVVLHHWLILCLINFLLV